MWYSLNACLAPKYLAPVFRILHNPSDFLLSIVGSTGVSKYVKLDGGLSIAVRQFVVVVIARVCIVFVVATREVLAHIFFLLNFSMLTTYSMRHVVDEFRRVFVVCMEVLSWSWVR